MLVVLMALVEMGRTKVHKATRWLWLLLSGGLFVSPVGCESSSDNDATGPADSREVSPDIPQTLYGPPPLDAYDLVPPDTWEIPQTLYGPPADVVTETSMDVPPPLDIGKDCEPVAYYGPKPCESDQECVDLHGAGWYCDEENSYDDGCGGQAVWPVCKEGPVDAADAVEPELPFADVVEDCPPAGWYGPPPCQSDEECQQDFGPDWYCNKDHTVETPCGPDTKYPMCEKRPDVDVPPADAAPVDCGEPLVFYGPPPCTSDEQCQAEHGEGWYCDKSDPCMPDWCRQKTP